MLNMSFIAVLGIIGMYACYKPVCGYLRHSNNASGRKGRASIPANKDKSIGFSVFIAIFAAALLARIIIAVMYRGYEVDINCFISWSDMVFNDGFSAFYKSESFTDYPPGYMYILYLVGAVRSLFGMAWDSAASTLMVKLPAIIADMASGWLIYRIASKRVRETGAALLSALYLFCPAVILDSAVWGQTDAVFTLCVALMCYLVTEEKLIPSYFVFAIGILIKPQTLIFTPVLICGIIDQVFLEDFNWNKFFKNLGFGIAAILLIGLLMMPYGFNDALSQYTETLGSYEYASVNAYNIWTFMGLNWVSQDGYLIGITYKTWGMAAIVLAVVFSIIISLRCKKSPSKYYFIGAFIVTCVFVFSVRMHERYIFPVMLLLIMCYSVRQRKEIYILYTLMSAMAFLNIVHVLFFYDPNNFVRLEPATILIAAGMLVTTVYMFYITAKYYWGYTPERNEQNEIAAEVRAASAMKGKTRTIKNPIHPSSVLARMEKNDYIAMFIIMAVYSVIAFMRLGNMEAPETGHSVVNDGQIFLDMGEEKSITEMWDFLGYKNNPKYYIEYSSDGNNWTTLCGEGSEWDAGSVFAWNKKELGIMARYIKISAAADNWEDSIHELVFIDGSGSQVLPANYEEYAVLFDEQDMFGGRKSNLNSTYFDEIYHARTAYEMINHLYCYENTHPPLGKIFIACGVLMFGMNPFGWRFAGTLFGVLMVPAIYNLAKKFFKETWIATVITLLFTFDFMHFVQTRIATIDVFVTLFIILSYYFMYCYTKYSFYDTDLKKTFIPLGLCGITMGFGWASKWTGIYSSAGLCIIFFAVMAQRFREYIYACNYPKGNTEGISHKYIADNFHKKFLKTIGFCCIFFVLIPVIIYLLSYIPFNDGTDRGFFEKVIEAQKTMFNYHSNLSDGHDYSSKWYQWPIMYRPIWYYDGTVSDTLREGISAFGNPLVWWAGIPAFIYMLYLVYKERDTKAAFLSIGYMSQYLPWFFVSRTVFIYHYFPSVPFVTVMLGYSFYRIVQKRPSMKKAVYIYAVLAIGLFILFYPVLSGKAINPEFATRWLKWFDSWVLLRTW
ncbi:MAG: phospholipid carrier-dependent glycosyltransferase [Lachnospiraceae bacterium]|nr:phospholipid carrier-dependent glycosyltransferase [Lachnospiraceae bacterium]